MTRPRVLDLYSCAGIAADGYAEHFDVYVVDNDRAALRHNPHPQLRAHALAVLRLLMLGGRVPFTHRDGRVEWLGLADFALIHASPPCQLHSATRKLADAQGKGKGRAVDLLTPTLELLERCPVPWIVENVERSPLRQHPRRVRLCGSSFGLKSQRHRLFAHSPDLVLTAPRCDHAGAFDRVTIYRNADGRKHTRPTPTGKPRPWGVYYAKGDSIPSGGRTVRTLEGGHYVMGVTARRVPWKYLCEALPPVYTSHLGRQVLEVIQERGNR